MTVLNEGKYIGDVLHWEENERFSRDVVTLAADQLIEIGTILAKHTETKTYHVFNPSGKEGLNLPRAISLTNASTGEMFMNIVVVSRHAIVKSSGINWPADITDKQKQDALNQLHALGLVVRY